MTAGSVEKIRDNVFSTIRHYESEQSILKRTLRLPYSAAKEDYDNAFISGLYDGYEMIQTYDYNTSVDRVIVEMQKEIEELKSMLKMKKDIEGYMTRHEIVIEKRHISGIKRMLWEVIRYAKETHKEIVMDGATIYIEQSNILKEEPSL